MALEPPPKNESISTKIVPSPLPSPNGRGGLRCRFATFTVKISLLPGCLLMGIIFYILDCSAAALDPKFSGLSIAMHGINLSNLSLMSSCLGGGLFCNMILFWLMPRYISRVKFIPRSKLPIRKAFSASANSQK